MWKVEYQGRMVAVKALKVSQISNLDKIRRVGRCSIPPNSVNFDADCYRAEFLQGGHGVEKSPPSTRTSVFGGDN